MPKNGWKPRPVDRTPLFAHRKNQTGGASAGGDSSPAVLPVALAVVPVPKAPVATRTRKRVAVGDLPSSSLPPVAVAPPTDGSPAVAADCGEMSDGTFGPIYSVGVVADSADGIDALGGVAAVDAESIVADAADGIGSVGGAADIADGILPNDDEVVDVPIE